MAIGIIIMQRDIIMATQILITEVYIIRTPIKIDITREMITITTREITLIMGTAGTSSTLVNQI